MALLQGRGSVQSFDARAHRVRKELFLDMMTDDRLAEARRLLAEEWEAAAQGWRGRTIALRDEFPLVMTRTALRWCGIDPDGADAPRRAREFSAMIEGAGGLGPSHLRARWLRARAERWARETIRLAREGEHTDTVAGHIARHRDADGALLGEHIGGVELLNFLRPIVAVARFGVFAAHALHVHLPDMTEPPSEEEARLIGHEVRRFYPFFPVIGGRVLEPFEWRGTHFAEGAWLLLDLYGTDHDPGAWTDPEAFRPSRHRAEQPGRLVPQGGGDHHENHRCPGEWLTIALLTESVRLLSDLDYRVPPQDLAVPLNRFPPWPSDGMRIRVS
ncbi:MAG: cytochrome P450 [Pseudooceanicola sp.]